MLLCQSNIGAGLLRLALFVAANPFGVQVYAQEVERRDDATRTVTVTTKGAPTTVTVNPRDPTITRSAGFTTTVAPPDSTRVKTSGCVSFSFISPPADRPASVATVTVTQRDTVTATNTDRVPLTTQTVWTTPAITVATPLRTLVSVHCTNTLVVSYYDGPLAPATYTYSYYKSTSYVTGLCKTTTTRTTTIPGVTLPTTKPLADWEWFTSGTTLATKHSVAILELTQVTVPGVTTSTRCNSLNPTITSTTTLTFGRPASTVTTTIASPSECGKKRDIQARQEPIEVQTVVYTTVTVIDNTVRTLTGTAILDVKTQSFPKTAVVYTTRTTAGTTTVTSLVCSLPTA
ncbi:hypothetical protein QBC42DRAFT_249591 [Cladorrhinum samala]|uniref:Uncharacterized protein n=1 Tax=Cladorrhinum samala TaxID=585594 RepID=A0AAV9HWQ9_9PEZI|nr:hypothetical protein QBC42DRAFT_249591 [Cladorrhinum samala]